MKTLVIANQKGGVGKSTITAALGVCAEQTGKGPVVLIDTDTQQSLSKWWNRRESKAPLFASVEIGKLAEYLGQLKEAGVALVVIDTQGAITTDVRKVIACADLVLIPTRASAMDLDVIADTVEMVESAKKRMIFVINGAANRAGITGKTAVVLSQHGTVAPAVLFQRTVWAECWLAGLVAQEVEPDGKVAAEVAELCAYVLKQLEKTQ